MFKLRRQVRRRDFGDADPVCTEFLKNMYGNHVLEKLVGKGYLPPKSTPTLTLRILLMESTEG